MLGMGLGLLLGNMKAYMFIGIGTGLLAAAIVFILLNRKK